MYRHLLLFITLSGTKVQDFLTSHTEKSETGKNCFSTKPTTPFITS